MKTQIPLVLAASVFLLTGCTDKAAEAEKARQEAEAKARAEAARKEMDALPKTFRNPDYFKKNEPPKPAPKESDAQKKPAP